MKIAIIDTCYPQFLEGLYFNPAMSYSSQLQMVLDQCFGTFDAYSRNLRALGWDAIDVIANYDQLQAQWKYEHDGSDAASRTALAHVRPIISQICHYKPDVVFLQDLSINIHIEQPIAAQCSCPWPGDEKIRQCDVVFTSFPHYVPRIEALGVKAVFNPLAFDPIVLERSASHNWLSSSGGVADYFIKINTPDRIYDCVFIGGVGNPSHWKRGMEVLEIVAREIPTFKWWGYGLDTLPADSALRDTYQGEAWGLDMYRIMLQSKLVLNRHGEVAQGFSNNMRMFEATGCGALLLTEDSPNLSDYFTPQEEVISYTSPDDAVEKIRLYLLRSDQREWIAANGQKRTLRDHTYAQRMKTVSDVLTGMLCPA